MKRTWKQIGSLFMAVCMVLTMLPMTAFAEEQDSGAPLGASGTITAFGSLESEVAKQKVALGTPEKELNLPGMLAVTVTESVYNIASGSDAAKQDTQSTVAVSGWTAKPSYDGDAEGDYIFTPALDLPDGITLADGVTAPEITVTVETAALARGGISLLAAGDIEINPINFPDDNFRAWLQSQTYGSDNVLKADEIAAVTGMYLASKGIADLTGIEYFTALKQLNCLDNQLTELDVTKNTVLEYLLLSNNQLTALNVSANNALRQLYCDNNRLTSLDLSNNTALIVLDCDNNRLTSLDLSNNTALVNLSCSDQAVALTMNQSSEGGSYTGTVAMAAGTTFGNAALSYADGTLTSTDATVKNSTFTFATGQLGKFLTGTLTLAYVAHGSTNITDQFPDAVFLAEVRKALGKDETEPIYDKDDFAKVTILNLNNKTITSLKGIEYFTALMELNCYGNQLTELDVSRNTALTTLNCGSNQLTELDVSQNTVLTKLNCSSNPIETLDVSQNTALTELNCSDSNLTTLTVDQNTALTTLQCGDNQLMALDVSQSTALTTLSCDYNQLTALDVSDNTALTTLQCDNNQLTMLKMGQNTALTTLNCGSNKLTTLDVSKNTALTTLSCTSNNLTTLDVSLNTSLTTLRCTSNKLTTLDVSKNTVLTTLNCASNNLTTLDVSLNTSLDTLHCSSNNLTTLDVSKNTVLTVLDCRANKLAALDLRTNSNMKSLFGYDQTVSLTMAGSDGNYTVNVAMDSGTTFGNAALSYTGGTLKSTSNTVATSTFTSPTGSSGKTLTGTLNLDYMQSGVTDAQTPNITGQPVGATYTQGAAATPLSVTASVTDGGTLSYQWYDNGYASTPNGGMKIDGATDSSYTPPTGESYIGKTYYYCTVTNTNNIVGGNKTVTSTSNTAAVTVNPSAPATYTATLNIRKDDAAYTNQLSSYTLKLDGSESTTVTMTGTGATRSANVPSGTWKVYEGSTDYTGVKITVNDNPANAALDYYTVNYSVDVKGTASDGMIHLSETSLGGDIFDNALSGNRFWKGSKATFTATGAGADSYTYAWSGTHGTEAISGTGSTLVINSVQGKVDVTCTITGSGTPSKSVTVLAQNGTLTAGTAGTAVYILSCVGITETTGYVAVTLQSVSGEALPAGITGSYSGSNNAFSLNIDITQATPAGSYPLKATIDGVVSNPFTLVVGGGPTSPIEISGFEAIADENVGKAGSAICANVEEVRTLLQAAHPFALAMHSGNQMTPFLITSWEDTDGYNPNKAGSYTFTAAVAILPGYANSGGHTVSVEVVVEATDGTAPTITSANSTTFTVGTAGSFAVTASNSPTFFAASGTLPIGVVFTTNGVLSGTPAAGANGTYNLSFIAINGSGTSTPQNFTLTVAPEGGAPTDAQTPNITVQPVGATYKQGAAATALSVTASVMDGGTLTYQWYGSNNSELGGAAISGATAATFTPSTGTVGTMYYRVEVTNTNNSVSGNKTRMITSTPIAVTVQSGGGNGDDSGGGGGGGGGGSYTPSTPTTTTPEKKPDQPVTVAAPITATAGTNGTASANIPDKAITDAIAKAQADARAQGRTTSGISVGLNVTMPKGATSLTATLTQSSLNSLVSAGVSQLELEGAPVSLGLDLSALKEIQKQSGGNISITIAPATGLSKEAQALLGNRPVYNITVSYVKDGKTVNITSLGSGAATLSIPYTPGKNEAVGYLFGVYVDANGKAQRIDGSAYDANSGSLLIPTGHFSVYGVGYTAPSAKFTDIGTHWGKEAIDYVVGRGLLSGTSETTFAPDTAMTRGMLVTALGRLAGVDVKAYTTNSFTDVKADSAFRPYIEWARSKSIIQGIGNQQFAPDRAITREEIAVIFANYAKATDYKLPVTREAATYADASSIGSTYKTAVTAMQQAGIMMGGSGNKFNPKVSATRAELSSMLHRYIKLTIDPATAQGWAKNDAGQYRYYKDGKALTGTQTIDGVKYFFETNGTLKPGWVKDGDNWRYYSGNKMLVGWWDIGSDSAKKTYYFTKDGLMVSGKWLHIDGKWYYFYADGSLARSAKIDTYEVDENGVRKTK